VWRLWERGGRSCVCALLACLAAGCVLEAHQGYDCTVVQVLSGATCEEPVPACHRAAQIGATFQLALSDTDRLTWDRCFSCIGTWKDGDFSCVLHARVTAAGGRPCPPEPWVLLQQDPDPTRPLNPGEIYAGIPVNNSFGAHCVPESHPLW